MNLVTPRISRRSLIKGALAVSVASAIGRRHTTSRAHARSIEDPHHLVWVWEFAKDGGPDEIGVKLRDNGLGMLLKTHDGVRWMSQFDTSPYAVSGPGQVAVLANYYESAAIPFHAWCIVQGKDPTKEAQMAADVLSAGARSLYISLQPKEGFWEGTERDAEAFGSELRRLQPNGRVVLTVDPRPWMLRDIPVAQFTAFSNEIAPQDFWHLFDVRDDYARFEEAGFVVPSDGVSPEFVVTMSRALLGGYNLPLAHACETAPLTGDEFSRFLLSARPAERDYVSVWRFGEAPDEILTALRDAQPVLPPPPPPAAVAPTRSHVVEPGDTLSVLAETYEVSVDALVNANALEDADSIFAGQTLKVP